MYSFLLALIYLAFISLGLPDGLLGSAWPTLYPQLGVSVSYAGVVTMIIAAGTIVSSLNASRLIRKMGTGLLTTISVLMTAIALFGFAKSDHFWMLCLWAIPYGLGAGAVDAALNNFVALHYASRHMSWLHCFWGVGASLGPYIMGYSLAVHNSWPRGYLTVGFVQTGLVAVLIISLPIWIKQARLMRENQPVEHKHHNLFSALRIKGVRQILLAFFAYCALESTTGLWASTYLVLHRGLPAEAAARWGSLFFLGITFGRFLNGFVADRLGNRTMIRIGLVIIAIGLTIVLLPQPVDLICLIGLVLVGLGCAPVYPCIIHETPRNFGAENSQSIIGIQMASAYTGTTLMPPLFGLIAKGLSISLYPVFLGVMLVLMLVMTEWLNRLITHPWSSASSSS
ncbi:MAG TPA: MFS transporter [Clostridiales bacterium]|nr:MFS transporter [Clostridiales bacterium]